METIINTLFLAFLYITLTLFAPLAFLFIITDYEIMVKNVRLKDVFAWLGLITGAIAFVSLFGFFIAVSINSPIG